MAAVVATCAAAGASLVTLFDAFLMVPLEGPLPYTSAMRLEDAGLELYGVAYLAALLGTILSIARGGAMRKAVTVAWMNAVLCGIAVAGVAWEASLGWRIENSDKHPLAELGAWWCDIGVLPASGRLGIALYGVSSVVLFALLRAVHKTAPVCSSC